MARPSGSGPREAPEPARRIAAAACIRPGAPPTGTPRAPAPEFEVSLGSAKLGISSTRVPAPRPFRASSSCWVVCTTTRRQRRRAARYSAWPQRLRSGRSKMKSRSLDAEKTNRRRRRRQNAAPIDQVCAAPAEHVQAGIRVGQGPPYSERLRDLARQAPATGPWLALDELQGRHGRPRRVLARVDDVGDPQATSAQAPPPAAWSAAPRRPRRGVAGPRRSPDPRRRGTRTGRRSRCRCAAPTCRRPLKPQVLGENVELKENQALGTR